MYEGNVKITQQINNLALAPLYSTTPTKGDVFPKPAQSEKTSCTSPLLWGIWLCAVCCSGAVIGCDKYSLSCQDIVIVSFLCFGVCALQKGFS